MAISLSDNSTAQAIRRHLITIGQKVSDSIQRLASGKRIVRVGDDAAGVALSAQLMARIRSSQQVERNAMDAISLVQVAESGINEINNMILRLHELAVQASSDTVDDHERAQLELEFSELSLEIERMAQSSKYLGTYLLNGAGREFSFQVGVGNSDDDRIYFNAGSVDVTASSLGVTGLTISDKSAAFDAIESLRVALERVQIPRAQLSAVQSRLQSTVNHIALQIDALTDANGRIENVDMAYESAELAKNLALNKAAIAVLAQANSLPGTALRLLSDSPIKD